MAGGESQRSPWTVLTWHTHAMSPTTVNTLGGKQSKIKINKKGWGERTSGAVAAHLMGVQVEDTVKDLDPGVRPFLHTQLHLQGTQQGTETSLGIQHDTLVPARAW